jgi:DNA-binding CsgD family transcriptional regulator
LPHAWTRSVPEAPFRWSDGRSAFNLQRMSGPFVGRRREVGTLTGLVRRALQERSASAGLVSGVPGSGKTRLLDEAVRQVAARRVIRLVGFQPMQQVPLGAVADLLHVLARVPVAGAALERLVFGNVDEEAIDPLRIFEAAHRAFAASGPLLLAIDDLQWVDERSVALVHYLLRSAHSARQPFVVIAVARPSPVSAAFRAGLEADLDADRSAIVDLEPLPLVDGVSLVRSIDASVDETTAIDLWRRAAGSPFWLEALARTRARADPAGLIRQRLLELSPDGGALQAALAIAARPLTESDLVQLLAWDVARVRGAADELIARGLALDVAGALRPAHDLIREATAAGLPAATERRLHARLADWIEAAAGDDLSSLREALEHRVAAGLPAVDLAMRLLASPQHRLLGADGLKLVTSISDALDQGASVQVLIDRGLAELAAVLGEQELALERWKRVATFAADPDDRHRASVEAARAAYRLRRSHDAHEHLARARSLPSGRPEADVALSALQAEIELWLDHETAIGAATAARSLAAALEMTAAAGGVGALTLDERRASLAAHEAAIDAALQQDRAADVLRLSEASVVVAEGVDIESYLSSLMRPAFGLRTLGLSREAAAKYSEAWRLAQEQVLPTAMVEAGNGLSRALRQLGRLEEARRIAAETVELERRVGHPPRRWGNAPSILHAIEIALGDTSRIEALREDARSEPDPHYRLNVHQLIAAWQAWLLGPRAAAAVQAELAAAKESAALAACPRCSSELDVSSAELLARIGLVEEAQRALATWEAREPSDSLRNQLWGDRARATIAHALGDDAAAIALLDRASEVLEREGLVEDLLGVLLDLGAALTDTDRARAVRVYTKAATTAERAGAKAQGRLATQALRRLGVRTWRRGRTEPGDGVSSLSEREREVAWLIAEGSSNREIADRLVVSPKTVERHVTNILAKVGLRNRTELASRVLSGLVRVSPDE